MRWALFCFMWWSSRKGCEGTPLLLYLLIQLLLTKLARFGFIRFNLFWFGSAARQKWECVGYPVREPSHQISALAVVVQLDHGDCASIALLILHGTLSLRLHLCLLDEILHIWLEVVRIEGRLLVWCSSRRLELFEYACLRRSDHWMRLSLAQRP